MKLGTRCETLDLGGMQSLWMKHAYQYLSCTPVQYPYAVLYLGSHYRHLILGMTRDN